MVFGKHTHKSLPVGQKKDVLLAHTAKLKDEAVEVAALVPAVHLSAKTCFEKPLF